LQTRRWHARSAPVVRPGSGRHGWYWRNRSDQPVKLTLRTRGDYITIEQMF